MVKDLKQANLVVKKSSNAYTKLVGTILKKNVSTIPKARKALVKARVPLKSLAKLVVKAPIEEVVISGVIRASVSGRIIRLP